MPRKEPDSTEGPPDLLEIISSIKNKIKKSFEFKEVLPERDHSCSKDERQYFIELFVKCKACKKVIKQKTITNPYQVAALLVVISYGASQFVDYAVTDNRYPLDVEYAVMDSCTNSYERPLARLSYKRKKTVCLCALEDSMNQIFYIRYAVDKTGFLDAFKKNTPNCIEQQK